MQSFWAKPWCFLTLNEWILCLNLTRAEWQERNGKLNIKKCNFHSGHLVGYLLLSLNYVAVEAKSKKSLLEAGVQYELPWGRREGRPPSMHQGSKFCWHDLHCVCVPALLLLCFTFSLKCRLTMQTSSQWLFISQRPHTCHFKHPVCRLQYVSSITLIHIYIRIFNQIPYLITPDCIVLDFFRGYMQIRVWHFSRLRLPPLPHPHGSFSGWTDQGSDKRYSGLLFDCVSRNRWSRFSWRFNETGKTSDRSSVVSAALITGDRLDLNVKQSAYWHNYSGDKYSWCVCVLESWIQ